MDAESIYERWDVSPVINAAGTKTRIGGSRIRPEALKAMEAAATEFVSLPELQAAASQRIAELTGAEAGYVSNGAAGGLMLAAAACLAGDDPGAMARLPDTEGIPDEIIMPRHHRTGYDHALRAAGATIVDIGTNDRALGTGAQNVEPWEYSEACTDQTAAIAHIQKDDTPPAIETVSSIAAELGVPLIVDAAAELPPRANLTRFIDAGADLVVFSGGKGIRGPQTTGIVAGRADLISSIAMQNQDMHAAGELWEPPESLFGRPPFDGVPRQGIGRPLKVGKEELVGLLVAIDAYLAEDESDRAREWEEHLDRIQAAVDAISDVTVRRRSGAKSVTPELQLELSAHPMTATTVVTELRHRDPGIVVGTDDVGAEKLSINPMCLTADEAATVGQALVQCLNGEH